MKRILHGTMCFLIVSTMSVAAGQTTKVGGRSPQRASAARDVGNTQAVHFSEEQVRVIREHYATRYRNLPPGLQKKYARTGQLPPGWQSKMEPLPVVVERSLPPLPSGYRRGVIDGHAVIYHSAAGTIVDVAVLF